MRGRDEFASGAIAVKNMIPMLQGPVTRRGGTRYVAEAAGVVRTEAFVYNENNAYVVCFKNLEIKIKAKIYQIYKNKKVSQIKMNKIQTHKTNKIKIWQIYKIKVIN